MTKLKAYIFFVLLLLNIMIISSPALAGVCTPVNPCQNDGICSQQGQTYTCSCPAGYTGTNCETDIDERATNPCQNGGGVTESGPTTRRSIQAAINAAEPGGTVKIQSGTYRENVVVNKTITLQGVDTGAGLPVVDAGGSWSAFNLSVKNCILNGFIVRNSENGIFVTSDGNTISGNTVSGNRHGILVHSSNDNTISGNNASNNTHGIWISHSNGNIISENTVENKEGNRLSGIVLEHSSNNNTISGNNASNNTHGIAVQSSSNNNTISGNTVSGNHHGILVYSSKDNTISGNNASNNFHGIWILNSNGNIISENTVENKEGNRLSSYGIFLEHSSNNTISGNNASYNAHGIWINHSNGNKIYLNTFNNTQNAWSNSSNTWNSITKVVYRGNPILVGNCWSDYTGTDSNGDGIGDLPYNISGGSEKDKYPIMTRIVGLGPSKSLDEVCKAVVIKVGKPASSEKFASRSDMGIDDIYYLHLDIGGEGYHKKGYSTDGTITTWGFEHALNVNAQDKSSQPPYEPIPMLIQVQAWVSNPPYPFTDHIADYITMQNAPLTDKNVDEISRVIKKGGKVGLWIDDQFEDEIKKLAKCLDTTPTYSNNSSSGCIDEFKDCAGFSKICMEDRR